MCFFLEVGVEVAVVGEEKNRNRNYYALFFYFWHSLVAILIAATNCKQSLYKDSYYEEYSLKQQTLGD